MIVDGAENFVVDVDVDKVLVADVVVIVGVFVVVVVVVHSISQTISSDASETLHLVPLPTDSCTMVLFHCCMPCCKSSTHPDSLTSQSDYLFHAVHSQSPKIRTMYFLQLKMMRVLNFNQLHMKSDYLSG